MTEIALRAGLFAGQGHLTQFTQIDFTLSNQASTYYG